MDAMPTWIDVSKRLPVSIHAPVMDAIDNALNDATEKMFQSTRP